jgi:hypothetical protein
MLCMLIAYGPDHEAMRITQHLPRRLSPKQNVGRGAEGFKGQQESIDSGSRA